jgi:hypothetical protein
LHKTPFRLAIPQAHHDGYLHSVSVKFLHTAIDLTGSPANLHLEDSIASPVPEGTAMAGEIMLNCSRQAILKKIKARKKLAICAIYQPKDWLDAYQKHLFKSMQDEGYVVVAVNPFPKCEAFFRNAKKEADALLARENIGYDFGSWISATLYFKEVLSDLESLVWLNDSNFGPVYPLAEMFAHQASKNTDFWGVTDSWEKAYHVQSYFVHFSKRAIQSEALLKFCNAYQYPLDKTEVIETGEIGLTQSLLNDRLSASVYCAYKDVVSLWVSQIKEKLETLERTCGGPFFEAARDSLLNTAALVYERKPCNPTHYMWDTLLADFRAPFIKRELLNVNPVGIPTVFQLYEMLEGRTDYDTTMIDENRRFVPAVLAPPLAPLSAAALLVKTRAPSKPKIKAIK